MLLRARQKQEEVYSADPEGTSEWIIGSSAIQYGFEELSKRKRETYLQAEFPHLWKEMEKFSGGKSEYNEAALKSLLGPNWKATSEDLLGIGFLSKIKGKEVYSIPFLYMPGMNLTQGKA